jgi:outer membrane protein assembly factor BamD
MQKFSLLALGALSIFIFSCRSPYEKLLVSKDINQKVTAANQYYDQKKYYKASQVYESLMPALRGTKNYEELYYRYCYSFYYLEDYLSASYQFKNFVSAFPKSTRADECEYMAAICLFKMSPKASLDPTATYKAIDAMQTYVNTHPSSKNLTEANNYIDAAREKIEYKDAKAALLYYDLGEFKSSTVAYKSLMQAYPESKKSDYYQYMVIRSCYYYAKASEKAKQEERYTDAINAFQELKTFSPNSTYINDADKIIAASQNEINKLRNEHK